MGRINYIKKKRKNEKKERKHSSKNAEPAKKILDAITLSIYICGL